MPHALLSGLPCNAFRAHNTRMTRPFFFGYGSLVNTGTHDYPNPARARIRGWRRAWRHSPIRKLSYLTAVPSMDSEIDGLLAEVPGHNWAALDEREHAYERLIATAAVAHTLPFAADIAIYAIPTGHHGDPSPQNPVLLSYLDTVVQGYLREFGEGGVTRFFDTTDGWQATILDDRAAPVYPRHVMTTPTERALVDAELARLAAVVKQL